MTTTLEIDQVSKAFGRGRVLANDGVSLTADGGEVLGVLGPNGAGKTTLLRQMLGLVQPDSGHILIDGTDVTASRTLARTACTYQPQTQIPMAGLRPRRVIELMARLRGAERAAARGTAMTLLERLDLADVANRPMQDLSGGVARLIAFSVAVAVPGRVIVLDEPTNDVDPLRRRTLWSIVREVADQGSCIVLVTHNVHEAERAVDRLVIMDRGRVVVAGTPAELRRTRPMPLRIEYTSATPLPPPKEVVEATRSGSRVVGGLRHDDVAAVVSWCETQQGSGLLDEFQIGPMTIEDIYVATVGTAA